MVTLKNSAIVPLTWELAKKHADMNPMPGERELKKSRVEELVGEIEAGRFNNCVWVIAVLKSSGKQFRADGHHTSTALISVPRNKFPLGAVALVVYYEIDNLGADASDLFLRIDDSDAVRNSTATMNSLAFFYKDLHEVKPAFIVTAMNGIVYHLKELNQQHRKKKDFDRLIKIHKPKLRGLYLVDKNYRTFILWLNHWNNLTAKDGEHRKASNAWLMQKPAVTAEAMTNLFAHTEAAKVFWDYMLDDAGPKGHPTKELVGRFNDWRSRLDPPKPDKWRNAIRPVWKQFLADFEAEQARAKKKAP